MEETNSANLQLNFENTNAFLKKVKFLRKDKLNVHISFIA